MYALAKYDADIWQHLDNQLKGDNPFPLFDVDRPTVSTESLTRTCRLISQHDL